MVELICQNIYGSIEQSDSRTDVTGEKENSYLLLADDHRQRHDLCAIMMGNSESFARHTHTFVDGRSESFDRQTANAIVLPKRVTCEYTIGKLTLTLFSSEHKYSI